ncbi:hypothetical protein Ae201684P_016028 [Aphanomyces euteiches]|uniref:HTH CENPB-type domain-containing protein n=1 Tax=Aphanomyces euteiches TaxID=100861 RepID=A0A6G0XHX4_9STRA|nr:hypothetical protein Ae201684_004572 [Aphanomyces euteiches]KAH9093398.1 hypothetical protein Ae201684P_016028 [Aphanomyces euteiches]KAH9142761.1 hypothetical protein AeRB84_013188 [Aphanomyces euteiches]
MVKSFTTKKKLEAVEYAKLHGKSAAASLFGATRSSIRGWMNQEGQLRDLMVTKPSAKRLSGGGRPLTSEDHDSIIFERIIFNRIEGYRVTRSMIINWATDLAEELDINLGCSTGWLTRFFSRHDLVLRQGTRRPILSDDQVIERGLNFIQQARSLISTYDIPLSCIYNLDETAIFFDHSKQKTVELRGALDVPIKSFGLEKTRITAVMAASADGIKRKPCILLQWRGDETSIRQENGMVLLTTKNSWMNSNAFIAYIKFEFAFHPRPLLLIFDSARSHISQMVKSFLHANNILTLVIPGGMTGFLQPADFSWFKSVKQTCSMEEVSSSMPTR